MNEQQKLAHLLQNAIDESNKMFDNQTQSHAYIIGYLQGTIKQVIEELK